MPSEVEKSGLPWWAEHRLMQGGTMIHDKTLQTSVYPWISSLRSVSPAIKAMIQTHHEVARRSWWEKIGQKAVR